MLLDILGCSAPPNGQVECNEKISSMGLLGENCTFLCDPGYMLQGSSISGICQRNGIWNGGLPSCVPLNCTELLPAGRNVNVSCGFQYQSRCTVLCDEDSTENSVTYLCNVTSDPNIVEWVLISGMNISCQRGSLAQM